MASEIRHNTVKKRAIKKTGTDASASVTLIASVASVDVAIGIKAFLVHSVSKTPYHAVGSIKVSALGNRGIEFVDSTGAAAQEANGGYVTAIAGTVPIVFVDNVGNLKFYAPAGYYYVAVVLEDINS